MTDFSELANVPREGVGFIQRAEWRELNGQIFAKINPLPTDYSGKAGQVLAVDDAEAGPNVASAGGSVALDFAQRRVKGFRFDPVEVTASQNITDQNDGQQLRCGNGSPIQLNVQLDGDPAVGVSDGFVCEILVLHDADEVQLLFSGVTNREPSGNTRIPPACAVRIQVVGTDCYVFGTTEP